MTTYNTVKEKDIQVGDLVSYVDGDCFGRCVANNGKTLKFVVLVPAKELQIKYGRPLDENGRFEHFANYRIDIPLKGNEEHFIASADIVSKRISKKGYHLDVMTNDNATFVKIGDWY